VKPPKFLESVLCLSLAWSSTLPLSLAVLGASDKPMLVGDIVVEGNRRIETGSVVNKLTHKVGAPFRQESLRDDIQNLYNMGYFGQILVRKEHVSAQEVRLIYQLEELPVIRAIKIEGNPNFNQTDMEKEMDVKVYEVASKQKIEKSLQKLKDKYKEKGFHLVELRYDLEPYKQDELSVTLKITVRENEQIRVRTILFLGNEAFSQSELKATLLTKEGSAISWLNQSGRYLELMFDQDVQLVRLWYLDHGYARVQVTEPQVLISADKRWVDLQMKIVEGEKYNFGKVSFSGDLLFTEEELRNKTLVNPGELFRSSKLQGEIDRLGDYYGDLGYAFVNVIPETQIHDDSLTVDIHFRFEKGNKMTVRNIYFLGNAKTYDKVIRRELRMVEGELYSSTKKKISERNLNRLGYFKKISFNDKVIPDAPDLMDIEIEVEEQSTGTLTVGAGFSTQDGFIAQGRISQENFLGTGQVIEFSAQLSASRTRFVMGYNEPYLFDYPVRFGASAYYTDRAVFSNIGLSFSELKAGGTLRFGFPLSDDMEASLTYKLERIWLTEIFNETIIRKRLNEGWLSSGILGYTLDLRNNRIRTTEGFYASASGEYAGLGGSLKFFKVAGNLRWYLPLLFNVVYRSNLSFGALYPVGQNPLPITERFVLGGINDVRGYRPGSIGPMVCAEPTRRDKDGNLVFTVVPSDQAFCQQFGPGPNGLLRVPFNIGGRYFAYLNTELEYPLIPSLGINLVAFADVGTSLETLYGRNRPTPDDVNNPYFAPPFLRASLGWGIRWWSPIGPLRFEFGYPLIRPLGEPGFDAQFAISPSF
jgi:outer membrane protein insertion porin family